MAAWSECCRISGCWTGVWVEEEEALVCAFAQSILPQQTCFLVSGHAFLYLELWVGLPSENGAFSAFFSIHGVLLVNSAGSLLLSCIGFLICLLFGCLICALAFDCHSFPFLSFPPLVPCPVSLCSPSARVVSCLGVFYFLSRLFHLSLQIIFNKGLAWSNLFSISSLDLK